MAQTHLILRGELAHQREQAGIVAQVFGGASAQDHDGGEFLGRDGGDRDVGIHGVAGAFHVGVPAGLGIVEDHVQPAPRRRRDYRFPVRLQESLAAVQRFVAIAAVTGNNQNLAGHSKPA